jgi:glycosyltransferase involved in cell wall biosynthesis
MRVAFYAPLKAPNHPVPSGDRRVARLLQAALDAAGHDVVLASDFRAYEGRGDGDAQARIAVQGAAEAERLIALWRKAPAPPDLWFSYHVYHKSPDHLGPAVSRALGLPYVIAEPSVAGKRTKGPFAAPFAAASDAIAAADLLLCMTELDVAGVAGVAPRTRIAHLPPFLDAAPFPAPPRSDRARVPRLLCVAMMRMGDKLQSYLRLAEALALLPAGYELWVVGGGEARSHVEKALAPLGAAVRYWGQVSEEQLPEIYAAADIYVWPAAGEAYGMALLEAQASGLPVVAGAVRGVPEIVVHGETGLLVPEDDATAFAGAVQSLLRDAGLRQRLGAGAARHARSRHGLKAAAARLDALLAPLVAAPRAVAGQ